MSQFAVAVPNRTLGNFFELYESVKGDPTLAVPRENRLLAFLDILRHCKINTDNLLACVGEVSQDLEIRLNQEVLRQIPDQSLKHLLAFNYFYEAECTSLKNYDIDYRIMGNASLDQLNEEFAEEINGEITMIVFSYHLDWPSRSEEKAEQS